MTQVQLSSLTMLGHYSFPGLVTIRPSASSGWFLNSVFFAFFPHSAAKSCSPPLGKQRWCTHAPGPDGQDTGVCPGTITGDTLHLRPRWGGGGPTLQCHYHHVLQCYWGTRHYIRIQDWSALHDNFHLDILRLCPVLWLLYQRGCNSHWSNAWWKSGWKEGTWNWPGTSWEDCEENLERDPLTRHMCWRGLDLFPDHYHPQLLFYVCTGPQGCGVWHVRVLHSRGGWSSVQQGRGWLPGFLHQAVLLPESCAGSPRCVLHADPAAALPHHLPQHGVLRHAGDDRHNQLLVDLLDGVSLHVNWLSCQDHRILLDRQVHHPVRHRDWNHGVWTLSVFLHFPANMRRDVRNAEARVPVGVGCHCNHCYVSALDTTADCGILSWQQVFDWEGHSGATGGLARGWQS